MRGSTNFRQGGGSTSIWQKSSDSVVCLLFAFFLVLGLISKKNNHFSRFKRGSKFFQGGSNFFQGGGGSNCLFPIETQITCDFPGGPDPLPPPPLNPHMTAIYLVSQSAKWCNRLLHLCLFSCNFVVCFQSSPAINRFLNLMHDCCLVYPTSFAIRLCFLQSLNKDSLISFCWRSFFFSFPNHFDRWCFSSPM